MIPTLKYTLLTTVVVLVSNYSFAQYEKIQPIQSKKDDDPSLRIRSYPLKEDEKNDLKKIFNQDFNDEIDPVIAFQFADSLNKKIGHVNRQITQFRSGEVDTAATITQINYNVRRLKADREHLRKYRDLFHSINRFIGTPKFTNSFLPLRSKAGTDFYYQNVRNNNFKLLQNIVIQGASDQSVVASELVTGYFSVLRVNLSTVIYNTNESDTAETLVNKIYNGGGLLSANINYPLFFRRWDEIAIVFDSNVKMSSDFNEFGNELPKDEFIGYFEPSLNVFLEMRLRKTDVRLFCNYKYGRVYSSSALNEAIGNTSGDSFDVSLLYAGINFGNKISISTNVPLNNINGLGGDDNYTVGIQYFPSDN